MTPKIGDLRTVTQRFDGKEWVLCLQSMPPKELSDEEIELYKHLKWTIEAYRDCAGFENKQLTFHHVCEALDNIDQYQREKENE